MSKVLATIITPITTLITTILRRNASYFHSYIHTTISHTHARPTKSTTIYDLISSLLCLGLRSRCCLPRFPQLLRPRDLSKLVIGRLGDASDHPGGCRCTAYSLGSLPFGPSRIASSLHDSALPLYTPRWAPQLLHRHDTTIHRCTHSFYHSQLPLTHSFHVNNYFTSADTQLLREQLTSTAATQLLREQLTSTAATQLLHKLPPNDVQGQTLPLSTAFYSLLTSFLSRGLIANLVCVHCRADPPRIALSQPISSLPSSRASEITIIRESKGKTRGLQRKPDVSPDRVPRNCTARNWPVSPKYGRPLCSACAIADARVGHTRPTQ
ncbi:unnamed protein product [Trichogramma brassicae]|uniref:Uncharacterized protein n=1 Tax=Trichogramma brassicae TaxID=86971 RepID=A0A6H5J3T6_9HYME|nr:unnamed protein product [Trichogramma brassicae]